MHKDRPIRDRVRDFCLYKSVPLALRAHGPFPLKTVLCRLELKRRGCLSRAEYTSAGQSRLAQNGADKCRAEQTCRKQNRPLSYRAELYIPREGSGSR